MLTAEELKRTFSDYPLAIENTAKLLEECFIDFEFGKNKNKKHFYNAAEDSKMLAQLCEEGMHYRYPHPDQAIRSRYEKEIAMIADMEFTGYFLINWDIVNYARRNGLLSMWAVEAVPTAWLPTFLILLTLIP